MSNSVEFAKKGHAEQGDRHRAWFANHRANIAKRDVTDGDCVECDGGDAGRAVGGLDSGGEVFVAYVDAGRFRVFRGQGDNRGAGVDESGHGASVDLGLGMVMAVGGDREFDRVAVVAYRS